jgi:uncharacterized low-complexity protein
LLLEAIVMTNKTRIASAIGAVAGASFAAGSVAADETGNPFQADDLNSGSLAQIGDKHKDKEGSCGEGSCGEGEGKEKDKDSEGSCGEGSCGEGSCGEGGEDKEGSCGEGSCGEGGEDKEGSCGEGSCGAA